MHLGRLRSDRAYSPSEQAPLKPGRLPNTCHTSPSSMAHVQQIVEQQVLRAARELEQDIDAKLHKLDNLDEDEMEKLRQKRIDDMKR